MCVCARRTYCETDTDPAHRKLSQLQAVVRYLTGKEPDMECKRKPKETRSNVIPCHFCEYRALYVLSNQVMKCCCSKLFLMPWSRLLWKPTGPLSCSTHQGECRHRAHLSTSRDSHRFFICCLSLWQHGRRSGNSIPRDPFGPDENPEIHGNREKNCKVSGNNISFICGALPH